MRRFNRIFLTYFSIGILAYTGSINARACTNSDLNSNISHSNRFHRLLLNKAEMGYLYSSSIEKKKNALKLKKAQNELQLVDAATQADLLNALKNLNKKHPTKIIFYGQSKDKKCVWLISSSGEIVSSSVYFEPENILKEIRMSLGVNSTNRKPRSGGECIFDSRQTSARTDKELATVQDGLTKASKALLPAPIASALNEDNSTTRLVIIPFSGLRSIPFAALPLAESRQVMIDKYAVIVAAQIPSVTKNNQNGSPSNQQYNENGKYLVVGDPDLSGHDDYCWPPLPNALSEAQYVAKRIGESAPLLGKDATFKSVWSKLDQNSQSLKLIFLATHGISDEVDPADRSFLALNGAHLHGSDIRKLKTKLTGRPIVVMSACQTGLGKTFAQGMFGLIEAWQNAGAAQVVASLWDVEDEGTAMLMKSFSDSLLEHNFENAEFAMADAIRSVKKINPDPSIWAAFNVFGEPLH